MCRFHPSKKQWFDLECVNVHDGKKYKMLNCKKANGNIPYNVVFPSQFAHLLVQYQEHPEAKSLAPDGDSMRGRHEGIATNAHTSLREKFVMSAKKQIANGKKATKSAFWNSQQPNTGEKEK